MKFLFFILYCLGINKTSLYNKFVLHLLKIDKLNDNLVLYNKNEELQTHYVQHLPDRYSYNLNLYEKNISFLKYTDIHHWVNGYYQNNVLDLTRFFSLNLCIDQILEEKIVGHTAELGVFRGNSAFLLAKLSRRINTSCYLFDTFEGFDDRDLMGNDSKHAPQDFTGTTLEDVKRFVGEENTKFIKGYFPQSLSTTEILDDFALVHIDCDLEAPFRAALSYFYPRLKKGGFLIMHDYSSLCWDGAKLAIDEFFADKKEFVIPIPDKSGTCIIRKT
ncbi:TylF/MycF/NovP-related O-methyltransferase [Mucilaginibacter lappiensis]|uniref:O-methyltransferase n=1 Tax=Mucilaginibacter lappiensis TaxID=354630 RepID=A0A841JJQ7_9SPHI|nr:TylF/MycF/NovP-related O-methyltransferase [Mucilaginibacter lappiensis]MBB6131177.1 hypothetical protein [Mucilaginibacter lappiensis]